MRKKLKVLVVDDHPIIVESYRNILLSIDNLDYDIDVDTANDCEQARVKIKASSRDPHPYDILFLDVQLPPSPGGKILSGEDLGALSRRIMPPATKVVILTFFNENTRIHNILKTIDPDGFLIKSDLNSDEFLRAFKIILKTPPYYSHTVAAFLRSQTNSNIILDEIDRSILYYLSKGVRTKNLTEYVSLSLAGIEKRKRQLKSAFGVDKHDDELLLEKAREKGFL